MATTKEPWGTAPLTTEGLANLGHPLSLGDFNQDSAGRYWRTIRGEKTYYPREWFDEAGTFTGAGSQPGDRGGQGDSDFFHTGTKWDWTKGEWHNPINWANVIGLAAAGGVGAGIAAPAIGAALGGSATTAGGYGPLAGGYGAATTSAAVPSSLAAVGGGTVASYLTPTTIGDLIKGGTSIYGTIAQSGAQKDATESQSAATKYAADLQSKAQAEQLAFLRQQAGYDSIVAEANRAGNYDQWAARQEMLGPVGQALGLPARRIPAYVPLPANPYGTGSPAPTPTGTGATTGTPTADGRYIRVGDQLIDPSSPLVGGPGRGSTTGGTASGGLPQIDPSKPIGPQAIAYIQSRGATPNATSGDYWASKWPELVARGQEIGDPQYAQRRLSQADEFGGGGAAAPAPAAAAPRFQPLSTDPLGSIAGYLQDPGATDYGSLGPLRTSALRPYYAGTVGSYLA